MVQKNPIDSIVGDVDSCFFLDLLLKERGSKRIGLMRSEDECLCFIWDWFWFSPWLSWIGVKPVLFVKGNDLIDPLSSDLVIFCNFPNRSSPLPLIYDSSDILVG